MASAPVHLEGACVLGITVTSFAGSARCCTGLLRQLEYTLKLSEKGLPVDARPSTASGEIMCKGSEFRVDIAFIGNENVFERAKAEIENSQRDKINTRTKNKYSNKQAPATLIKY